MKAKARTLFFAGRPQRLLEQMRGEDNVPARTLPEQTRRYTPWIAYSSNLDTRSAKGATVSRLGEEEDKKNDPSEEP